jgi:hypothetical protein
MLRMSDGGNLMLHMPEEGNLILHMPEGGEPNVIYIRGREA